MAAADVMREFLKTGVSPDLLYTWDEVSMPLDLQYQIGHHYRTVRLFASMADTRTEVRAMADDFKLKVADGDPAVKADAKSQMAMVVACWESAREFVSKEAELKAEAKINNVPRMIPQLDRLAMKKAVESVHGKIPAKLTPSSELLSQKCEEVEQDDIHFTALDELASSEELQLQSLNSTIDDSGRLKITRVKHKGKMPTSPEEFRAKLRLEANLWMMLATKFKHKVYFGTINPAVWARYIGYVLGEKVHRIEIPKTDGEGQVPLNPPWGTVLNYDLAMRKEVFRKVREGDSDTIARAFEEVVTDTELKELNFTSPLALMGSSKRSQATSSDQPIKYPAWEKGGKGGKGKGGKAGKNRGGSKGSQKGAGKGLVGNTPDGRRICFAYNAQGCKDTKCSYVHVCRVKGCQKDHPMSQHN
jgi:hypothetical protein